jgi:Serine/Threonine/Tyrosine Kinase found in polyvalent proteins
MSDEGKQPARETLAHRRADGADLVRAALDYIRGGLSTDSGASGTDIPTSARQKADLREWAAGVGLLLTPEHLPAKTVRGGQEHDLFHDTARDRYYKVTRDGVFGLSPGIELALVSSSQDARRFHLWEATPLEYLERLDLHNQLVPDINRLEGILSQPDGDLAIVTSQPRFDIVPVTEAEIDAWFAAQGFRKVTHSAYYREEDNLGVFDAHDKNVIRAGDTLVPFDVIPCRPAGGFQQFIADTLAAGHSIHAVRRATTTSR